MNGIRVAWLIVMVAVFLSWCLAGVDVPGSGPQINQIGEWHFLAFLALVVLTFPLGLLWAVLLNAVAYMLDAIGGRAAVPDALSIPLAWLGFVVIGYVQWFKLLPWLWRKWRSGDGHSPSRGV